jgi:hypothetical protein
MSRIIPFVLAALCSPCFAGQAFAQLTPPAGAAGAGTAPITGIPYGPANNRALSDPSGIGNAAAVPPLRANNPTITVPQAPLAAPSRAAAPVYYPYASQRRIDAYEVEPKRKKQPHRRSRKEVSSFTGICRGC